MSTINGLSRSENRIRIVQAEIAVETAKDRLDPNALGTRYTEIESICREMKDRANAYRTRNVDVLNPDQKAKLKILEDAMKLAPVISEAQFGNLIGGFGSAPSAFTSNSTGIGSSVAGGILGGANGCYLPFPIGGVVRTGDFAPQRNPTPRRPSH
jgi:hypothetical protein